MAMIPIDQVVLLDSSIVGFYRAQRPHAASVISNVGA